MRLVLLGTSGYHPSETRHTACLCLPEVGVVLDAGTGLFRLGDYLATREVDLFLSHAHLDHVVGLTYLLTIASRAALTRVTVHGEAEKLAAIRQHLYAPELFPVEPEWEARPLTGPVDLAGGGRLTSFPLVHPGGVLGFRLEWPGHSLAYVTDTHAAVPAGHLEQVRGVDVLVHECNFTDARADWALATGHSATSAVAQLARDAGVGRLILVHVDPAADPGDPVDLSTARRWFPSTELGTDRMEVEF